MSPSYQERLSHPKWQRKRLEAMQAAGWQCEECGDPEHELHVHHRWYVKGEPWDVPLKALKVLCKACHQKTHRLSEKGFPGPKPVRKFKVLEIQYVRS